MLALAASSKNEFAKLGDIARTEDISEKYLENIVAKIKPHGFIEVKRGAQGGYRLAKPAHEIRLAELFEILEGDVIGYESFDKMPEPTNNKSTISDLWQELRVTTRTFLQAKTLDNLCESYNTKSNNQMYFI